MARSPSSRRTFYRDLLIHQQRHEDAADDGDRQHPADENQGVDEGGEKVRIGEEIGVVLPPDKRTWVADRAGCNAAAKNRASCASGASIQAKSRMTEGATRMRPAVVGLLCRHQFRSPSRFSLVARRVRSASASTRRRARGRLPARGTRPRPLLPPIPLPETRGRGGVREEIPQGAGAAPSPFERAAYLM